MRPKIARLVAAFPAERVEEAREDVVQRHVVIAGDDQLGLGQRFEKLASVAELACTCPLGEIARHRDEIRLQLLHRVAQRAHDDGIDPPEMQIRQMHQRAHQGTITRSTRGRISKVSGLPSVTSSPSIDATMRDTPASSATACVVDDSNSSML